jgi:hypothetical protein
MDMNTAVKLSAYGAALALLAGGAYAAGSAVGPLSATPAASSGHTPTSGARGGSHGHAHGAVAGADDQSAGLPAGLASSTGGYTFVPADPVLTPGTIQRFTFRILGPTGMPVTAFEVEHDKRMHLIVVRRDTSGYQHLHPEMDTDGTWRVPLSLPAAGSYRAFADFTPTGGPSTTLGVDLAAAGEFSPATYQPSRLAQVDGYQVRLDGNLSPGASAPLTLTVTKAGIPVTDLQPYLAAYGHLVALREGDLAYLHVHPDGAPGDGRTPAGPAIRFVAEVPSAGTYRLFLDFQHNGVVRTAQFTLATGPVQDNPPGGENGAHHPAITQQSTEQHSAESHSAESHSAHRQGGA